MDAIVGALRAQQDELTQLLTAMDGDGWQRPSPCEGWTVADVVLHLCQTNEMAIGSATGRFSEAIGELTGGLGPATSVDEGAALMVERERKQAAATVFDRWRAGSTELSEVLGTSDPHTRVIWVAGELSARTLATTRLAETWIHTGDVAAALGESLAPTDRLWHIVRLAWRTLPYAFARAGRSLEGPVAFHLRGPEGDEWSFDPDDDPVTVIEGDAAELCQVAARRVDPVQTSLRGEGPDARAVLELVRTYA